MEIKISIPTDEDGFIEMECDYCNNRFMLHESVYSDDANLHFFCPICGLPNGIGTFYCQEVLEAVRRKATNMMFGQIQKQLGPTIRKINRGGLFKRIGAVLSLIVPLFVSAIGRSEELSNAMEARGYDPYAKRSRYRILQFGWRDLIGFVIVAAIFGGILALRIIDGFYFRVDFISWIFGVKPLF